MLRILRAFAWMRWRMLINAFERTGSRDVVERFSIAVEKLGPIIAAILIVPSVLVLTVVSVAAGFAVARGDEHSLFFVATRYILFFAPVTAILGPLFLPSGDRTNPVRLLLLPIPRSTIYAAQAAAALGEPWIILVLPPIAGFPAGLAAGGAFGAALVAILCGALLLLITVGIAALSTTLLHLAVRDRRRAEILGVIFILAISMAGLLPGMLQGSGTGKRSRTEVVVPSWVERSGRRVASVLPSELYVSGIRQAAAGHAPGAGASVLGLFAVALVIHGIGFLAFTRVLEGPSSSVAARGRVERVAWGRTLPGLSQGASAVALAHLKLAMRTTRGRTSLISPLMILAVFSVLAYKDGGNFGFGGFRLQDGLGLATFTSFVALIAMIPIAMNQFAVDRSGLTLVFLSPLPERELIIGKAAGQALIVLPMAFFCSVAAFVMFPAGSAALWISIPLGTTAVYLLVAPAAAVFSAVFPKLVDLSSIGGRGNAHGLAGLLGMVAFLVGGAPCALLVALATAWLHRPWLAPVFLLAWCGVAFLIARVLLTVVHRIFMARRENLAILVSRPLSAS